MIKVKTMLSAHVDLIFLIVTGILFLTLVGGLVKEYFTAISIITTFIFLGSKLTLGTLIRIPKYFLIYASFVISTLIHYKFIGGEIIYFWVFFIAGLYWLTIFNIVEITRKFFSFYLVTIGIFTLSIFTYYYSNGIFTLAPDNLFLPQELGIKHNHIGDLWAIILVLLFYKIINKPKVWQYILYLVGLFVVTFSLSRSALLSLITGSLFILYKTPQNKFSENIIKFKYPLIILVSLIFIYFGSIKSIFFSRPYFVEAIISLFSNPLGIGMGNFANASTGTNVVHNIVLEVVSGMGIFSIIFIYWLYKMAKDIFTNKNINVLYGALSIAMFINFSFDSTYVIPVFFWIWFITIALLY